MHYVTSFEVKNKFKVYRVPCETRALFEFANRKKQLRNFVFFFFFFSSLVKIIKENYLERREHRVSFGDSWNEFLVSRVDNRT